MKKLLFVVACFLTVTSAAFAQQTLFFSDIALKAGDTELRADDLKIPFSYGKWTPPTLIIGKDGSSVQAAFKFSSVSSARSELKNSGIELQVRYVVKDKGQSREKTTRYVYYLDDARSFKSSETFSFKNGYDVRVLRFSFSGKIAEH